MQSKRDIHFINKRIECWENTKELASKMPLPPQSIKVEWVNDVNILPISKNMTNVTIVNKDVLEVAKEMVSRGLRPLVLNLADNCFPGGHVEIGSGAQEESIFRCTNISATLTLNILPRGTYPIHTNQALLSKNISILKESESNSWKQISNPILVDIISCPGIRNQCNKNEELSQVVIEILEKKVELIFQTAIANNNDAVVLGALGCGAWNCPPEQVAKTMYNVTKKWAHLFTDISFAILSGTHDGYIINNRNANTEEDNYVIFSKIFRLLNI